MKKIVSVLLVTVLLTGCAGLKDKTRTLTEGATAGAVTGAVIGAGIGYAAGGKEGAVKGAIIGAAAGMIGGAAYGTHAANRKAQYVSQEDYLDACILTAQEVNDAVAANGQRPLERLDKLGLLNPRMVAVHMTQLLDDEISLLAKQGVNVVHCPNSNAKLASGQCRVADLINAGVNVSLGTDSAASNNNLDMFSENGMKPAKLIAEREISKTSTVKKMPFCFVV